MSKKERVTVDLDEESYYLDGEFWTSWDHYGEQMAYEINKLLNEQKNEIQKIYSTLDNRIKKLQEDLEKLNDLDKTEDLHPQAVEDVAIVLSISLNALKEFKKELMGDTE